MTGFGALTGRARAALLGGALALGALAAVTGAGPGRQVSTWVGTAALLAAWSGRRARGGWARLGVAGAWVVAAAGAGSALGGRARAARLAGVAVDVPVTIEAEVVTPPTREGVGFVVEIDVARAGAEIATLAPARGRVVLHVMSARGQWPLPGDRLRMAVTLRPLVRFHNPGVDEARADILRARGVAASALVPSLAGVARTAPAAGRAGPTRLAGRVRAALAGAILGQRREPGEARTLLAALVIGERAALAPELEDAFRRAGVTHVLSVSGLHLAAVALLLMKLLGALLARTRLAARVPAQRLAAALTAPALLIYALATGAAPATLRALVMALVVLGGVLLGRGVHVPTVIAIALAGYAAVAPRGLLDPSLQLSFAAVIALACVAGPIRRLLDRRLPLLPAARGRLRRALRWAARWAVAMTLASAAATLAGMPVSALHFGTFAPAGVLANVVVVPLAELVVIPLGLLAAGLGTLLPGLAALPLAAALAATRALLALVRAAATPAPLLAVAAPPLAAALAFYLAAGLALALRRGRARLLAVAGCALSCAYLLWPPGARAYAPPDGLRASFLDVGQGDAALIEVGGARLLVDAGGSLDGRGLDPGARAVLPVLRARAIDRIDVVVISHPHPDHIGGLFALAHELPIGELWWSGDASGDPRMPALLAELSARGTRIRRPPARATLGGALLETLHGAAADDGLSTNDNSIVLRVGYAGRAILLPGDLEAEGETLAAAYADLAADVLKLPHHGSRTSSTDGFLAAVQPRIAVLSCGRGNRFGFPHAEVVARLRARGIALYRTDQQGAVSIDITPAGALHVRAQW